MKYIDAEKLKERVTRLIASARKNDWWIAEDYLSRVIDIINSLQQEQQKVDLEDIVRVEFGTRAKVECGRRCVKLHWDEFSILARHFYELGLNARKEE